MGRYVVNRSNYWHEDGLAILEAAAVRVLCWLDPCQTGFVSKDELICEGWWRSFRYASDAKLKYQFLHAVTHMTNAYKKLRYEMAERNCQPTLCCVDDIDDPPAACDCDPTRPLEERELLRTALAVLDDLEIEVLRLRFGLTDGDEWGIVRVARQLKIGRPKANHIQATALKKARERIDEMSVAERTDDAL